MIIGKNGVYKTRTIRRVPVEERCDLAAIEEVKFTPWMIKERSAKEEHDGLQEEEHKTSVDIDINKEIELEVKLPPRSVDPNPRRVYITKAVIEKFGGTEGCLGCTTAMLGGKGVAHSEQCRERMEEHIRRDPTEKERWHTATRKIQEFVNKYGLKRKDEEPRGGRMNDGEDEKEEPVKKHARHEEGHMPGSSSTDPMPMQEQSPAFTTSTKEAGRGEASATGRRRDVDENWEDITAKIRKSGAARQRECDGQKDEDMLMIMDLMCEEATEDQENINDYREAKLEETLDWGQHPRMSWADAYDEECQSKIYDELTGHELDKEEVQKARMNEIDGLTNMGVWEIAPRSQCTARTGRGPIRGRWVDVNKGDDKNKVYRSRCVAMETRKMHGGNAREGLFAARLLSRRSNW